jgi:hypothetical protein
MALQAVHGAIAMPYWDYTRDALALGGAWKASPIFAADWFGNASSAEHPDHVLDAGVWAYTSIKRDARGYSSVTNPYGLLRSPWNVFRAPFVTRYAKVNGAVVQTELPGCAVFQARGRRRNRRRRAVVRSFVRSFVFPPFVSRTRPVEGGGGGSVVRSAAPHTHTRRMRASQTERTARAAWCERRRRVSRLVRPSGVGRVRNANPPKRRASIGSRGRLALSRLLACRRASARTRPR